MRAIFINAGEQTNASNTDHPVARNGHGDLDARVVQNIQNVPVVDVEKSHRHLAVEHGPGAPKKLVARRMVERGDTHRLLPLSKNPAIMRDIACPILGIDAELHHAME